MKAARAAGWGGRHAWVLLATLLALGALGGRFVGALVGETAVREALAARAEVGVVRYGGLLRRGWRWALVGGWQEALDLVVYLAADPDATPRERALAGELAELLTARLLRTPVDRPLAPVELREAA